MLKFGTGLRKMFTSPLHIVSCVIVTELNCWVIHTSISNCRSYSITSVVPASFISCNHCTRTYLGGKDNKPCLSCLFSAVTPAAMCLSRFSLTLPPLCVCGFCMLSLCFLQVPQFLVTVQNEVLRWIGIFKLSIECMWWNTVQRVSLPHVLCCRESRPDRPATLCWVSGWRKDGWILYMDSQN